MRSCHFGSRPAALLACAVSTSTAFAAGPAPAKAPAQAAAPAKAPAAVPARTTPARPAAAPPAAPAPLPAPEPGADLVLLGDLAAVGRACDAVRTPGRPSRDVVNARMDAAAARRERQAALERVYVVDLPAGAFRFSDYDPEASVLAVDSTRGLYALDGAVGLYASASEPLEFPLAAASARDLAAAHARGGLALRLWMHLDADPDDVEGADNLGGQVCATRAHTDRYQLAVVWLAAELRDTGTGTRVALHVTEPGRQETAVTRRLMGPVALRVGSAENAGDQAPAIQGALASAREPLEKCHAEHAQGVEGGLGISLQFGKDGALGNATVEVSSVEGDAFADCVLKAVRAAQVRGPEGVRVSVPLVWARD